LNSKQDFVQLAAIDHFSPQIDLADVSSTKEGIGEPKTHIGNISFHLCSTGLSAISLDKG
jgi:hypothetical protein